MTKAQLLDEDVFLRTEIFRVLIKMKRSFLWNWNSVQAPSCRVVTSRSFRWNDTPVKRVEARAGPCRSHLGECGRGARSRAAEQPQRISRGAAPTRGEDEDAFALDECALPDPVLPEPPATCSTRRRRWAVPGELQVQKVLVLETFAAFKPKQNIRLLRGKPVTKQPEEVQVWRVSGPSLGCFSS